MKKRISLIVAGILIILSGLYVSFGVFVYSGSEGDSAGYYYLLLTIPIVISGIFILRKGIISKK